MGDVSGSRLLLLLLLLRGHGKSWGMTFGLGHCRGRSSLLGTCLQRRFESRNFAFVGRGLGSFGRLDEPVLDRGELVDEGMSC